MSKYDKFVDDNEAKWKSTEAKDKEATKGKNETDRLNLIEADRIFESIVRKELNEAKASLAKSHREAKLSDNKVTHSHHGFTYTSAIRIEARTVVSTECKLEFLIGAIGSTGERNISVNLSLSNKGNLIEENHTSKTLDQHAVEMYVSDFINSIYNPHGKEMNGTIVK